MSSRLATITRTLLTSGYAVSKFARPAANSYLISLSKRDQLGAEVRIVALFTELLSTPLESRLIRAAANYHATPMVISTGQDLLPRNSVISHTLPNFYEFLGGEVRTDRIFRTDLEKVLVSLGKNKLPTGATGTADDILEDYSKECLRYLLDSPVRRYGQDRRFESLPDGLALARNKTNLFFDAKAYGKFYHPSADDIKRFAAYVTDFNTRYSAIVGRIWRFLVISGEFSKDNNAILDKSLDLEAQCDTQITFISSRDLARAVKLLRASQVRRSAINWKRVLTPGVFTLSRLDSEIKKIAKDKIIE